MVKVKEEPVKDSVEVRIGAGPEIDNDVQYYQIGSISDQIRSIWDEDEVEVKPKVEQIEYDPNRKMVIKLDRDYLQKHHRAKWTEYVLSTYRRRTCMKSCQVCSISITFDSPEKLIKHYKESHQKKSTRYKCVVCYFSSHQQEAMIRHWERKHKHSPKPSPTKKYTVSRVKNDPKNIWIGDDELVRTMFFNKPFECNICLKTFTAKFTLDGHKITTHSRENEVRLYKCDQCDKTFRLRSGLTSHKYIHTKKHSCAFCSNKYAKIIELRKHELRHRNELLTCEFCDIKTTTKLSLYIHYRKMHFFQLRKQDKITGGLNRWFQEVQTFECYRCKFIGRKERVLEHMAICKFDGSRSVNCADRNCVRKFESLRLMRQHIKAHKKGPNPMKVKLTQRTYECYICRYVEREGYFPLKKHFRKEHPVEIKCDVCNATFQIWCHLIEHKKIHGKRTFKCKYCSKLFRQKSGLHGHEFIHTKPVKCERCDFRCAKKVNLEPHMKHCTGKRSRK